MVLWSFRISTFYVFFSALYPHARFSPIPRSLVSFFTDIVFRGYTAEDYVSARPLCLCEKRRFTVLVFFYGFP